MPKFSLFKLSQVISRCNRTSFQFREVKISRARILIRCGRSSISMPYMRLFCLYELSFVENVFASRYQEASCAF
jgi:hypothetical protein